MCSALFQGFETIEFVASALLDMSLHQNTYGSADNEAQFDGAELTRLESTEMSRIGMPDGIIPRHRACHFARTLINF